MTLFIIGIVLIIISIIIFSECTRRFFHYHQVNKGIDELNNDILKNNQELINSNKELLDMQSRLEAQVDSEKQKLTNAQKYSESLEKTARKAYESYCDALESEYNETEKDYAEAKQILEKNYSLLQAEILKKLKQAKSDLVGIQVTRAAAIEAQVREKEIQEKADFYCLRPTEDELYDIHVLERVKPKLHQPRILCMLIWSTYFQKPMTTLCNNILGAKEKCGIYKITNQTNSMCYIGQSVDVAKRWKDHAKCGLGIDTPIKNKLYKAMQEDGLENFSWELLEECDREFLNEKEKFYIDLYQSDKFRL